MQIWNGSDEYCWRYRADTILSTNGQTDKVKPVYPPFNFVEAGGITRYDPCAYFLGYTAQICSSWNASIVLANFQIIIVVHNDTYDSWIDNWLLFHGFLRFCQEIIDLICYKMTLSRLDMDEMGPLHAIPHIYIQKELKMKISMCKLNLDQEIVSLECSL